jgi:hypothetical protein
MDPLQNDIWAHLGQVTDGVGHPESTPAPAQSETPPPAGAAADASDQRHSSGARRRFDRGGRRRADWPEDAGLSCCPGCGFETIQSLGALDSGDYLWQCPQCDRRFQTGRATRTML